MYVHRVCLTPLFKSMPVTGFLCVYGLQYYNTRDRFCFCFRVRCLCGASLGPHWGSWPSAQQESWGVCGGQAWSVWTRQVQCTKGEVHVTSLLSSTGNAWTYVYSCVFTIVNGVLFSTRGISKECMVWMHVQHVACLSLRLAACSLSLNCCWTVTLSQHTGSIQLYVIYKLLQ